jgi:hypothetical protein
MDGARLQPQAGEGRVIPLDVHIGLELWHADGRFAVQRGVERLSDLCVQPNGAAEQAPAIGL